MKRLILLSILLKLCFVGYPQATDLVVDCQTPGWLSSKINYSDQLTVRSLKVTGYINSSDLKFIGELVSNQNLNEKVDLSDVNIVNNSLDNNCFDISVYSNITLKCLSLPKTVEKLNSILPYHVFSNGTKLALHVDTLFFNCNVKYIEAKMFGARQFDEMPHHIIIGETVDSIPDYAFFEKTGLISIKMPISMKFIGNRAFEQTNQTIEKTNLNELKNLTHLGIGAFPGYQPDTIVVPKTLNNPFYLFSISHKDGQHIFIDDNINTISGTAIGSGGRLQNSYTSAKLVFHINNATPPKIENYNGNNNNTNLSTSTVYVPKGAKQAYLNSSWNNSIIIETPSQSTYSISLTSSGNGSANYNGTAIRNTTNTFSIKEGTNVTITFTPDNGYRIKTVKVNNTIVTVSNNQYTVSNINANTTVSVEFEAIPPSTYSLTISATGNGSALYNGTTVRGGTKTITVNEGANVGISLNPDNGYRIKSVKENNNVVTSYVSNGVYTINSLSRNTTIEVEFEAIPPTTYTFSITATGNGSASFDGATVRERTSSFIVNEGSNATMTFTPDNGHKVKSVTVNGSTVSVSNNQYTVSNINQNTTVVVEFEASTSIPSDINFAVIVNNQDGTLLTANEQVPGSAVNFGVAVADDGTVNRVAVDYANAVATISGNYHSDHGCTNLKVTVPNVTNVKISVGQCTYSTSPITIYNGKGELCAQISPENPVCWKNDHKCVDVIYYMGDVTTLTISGMYYCPYVAVQKLTDAEIAALNATYTLTYYNTNGSVIGTQEAKGQKPIGQFQFGANDVTVGEGQVFRGWFNAASGGKKYKIDDKVGGDMALYAVATAKEVADNKSSYSYNLADANFDPADHECIDIYGGYYYNEHGWTFGPDQMMKLAVGGDATISIGGCAYSSGSDIKIANDEGKTIGTISGKNDTDGGINTFEYEGPATTLLLIFSGRDYIHSVAIANHSVAIPTYTLSISASGNGIASYSGTTVRGRTSSFILNERTNVTITFTPDNGYRIKTVKVNGSTVTVNSNNQYTVSNIKANTTVSVEFEAIPVPTYTLTILADGGGKATYEGSTVRFGQREFTVNEGTSATISFVSDDGCRIKSVKVNGSTVSVSNNQYTISNINRNTTVTVEFEEIPPTTYTLSITASGNGSASYNGTTVRGRTSSFTVNEGENATITFTPDDGYRIKSVIVNNTTITVSNNQYTVSNITKNTTVTVQFEAITHTLTIRATGNGAASYSGTTIRGSSSSFTVNEGSNATITFSPDNGYRVKAVMVNGSTVSISNNRYTVSSISSNTTVSVEFEAIPISTYTLTITASGNGSAYYGGTTTRGGTNSLTVNEGTTAIITFVPDKGYRIKTLKVNNSTVTANGNIYTIRNITSNTTVTVEFEAITYTMSIIATGSGYASYNSTVVRGKTTSFTVNEGTNAIIYFYPDSGYRIKSLKVNGSTVSVSNNRYTVSDISSNTTVAVEFEAIPINTYTLSISATGNGSVSYNGATIRGKTSSFTVNEGSSVTISFSPDNGYRIKSVKVGTADVTASVSNNKYTINSIIANTTVSVEFEAITYTLSISATGNGSVSYNGATIRGRTNSFTVNEGTSATITFSPDNGYRIKTVKVNNTAVTVSNNQYTVNNISRNTTVEVEFEAERLLLL